LNRERLKEFRDKFRVVGGLPIDGIPANRIALSLVHPIERIDVAISAIRWIEPRRFKLYSWEKKSVVSRLPFVEISLTPYIRERIFRLTKGNVGESLEFIVNEDVIAKAIVREPLGIHESISISQTDYEDAVALAYRLRARWSEVEPKLVWREV
jgi:hypothetical protein